MSSGEDIRVEEGRPDPRLSNDPARATRYPAAEFPDNDPQLSNDPDRLRRSGERSAADLKAREKKPDPRLSNDPDRLRRSGERSAADLKGKEKKPDPRLSNDPDRLRNSGERSAADLKLKPGYHKLGNDTEETSLMTSKPPKYSPDDLELPNKGDNRESEEQSFFAKCKAIKAESTSFLGFVFALLAFLAASIFATVLIVISLAIPIAMLVIGAHFKDDCSGEDMIPIYLIVAGAVGIAKDVVNILDRCRRQPNDTDTKSNNLERIFNLFLFAWLITGCVYVYRFYDDVQHDYPRGSDYCNHTVYWFAFWINTISLALIGIGFLSFCLFTCWAMS